MDHIAEVPGPRSSGPFAGSWVQHATFRPDSDVEIASPHPNDLITLPRPPGPQLNRFNTKSSFLIFLGGSDYINISNNGGSDYINISNNGGSDYINISNNGGSDCINISQLLGE